jgi:hypothetical protein
MLCRKATALTVVMVSFVSTRLKRKTPKPETPLPDPIALALIRDENEQHRHRTLEMIYHSTDSECISMMKRAAFFGLVSTFRERGLVSDRDGVSMEEQVAMFLHVVGHNQRFRVVHQSFRRSIQTVHNQFHQVLYAVGELRNEIIKPASTSTHPKILGSHRWNPYFKVNIYILGSFIKVNMLQTLTQAF